MDSQVQTWVQDAIDCHEENDQGDIVRRGRDTTRFEILSEEILGNMNLDSEQLKVSRGWLASRFRRLYGEAWKEDNPLEAFGQKWFEAVQDIHETELEAHAVVFPLNLRDGGWVPEEIDILGRKLEQIERWTWQQDYLEEARGNPIIDRFEEQTPNDLEDFSFTYWRIEIEAREQQYAMDKAHEVISVFLGTIQFGHWYRKGSSGTGGVLLGPPRLSRLRSPFGYLVFDEEGYTALYHDQDPRKRDAVSMCQARDQWIEHLLDEVTGLDPTDELHQELIGALRLYHSALTDPLYEDAFLSAWQALETATLSEQNDTTETVLKRARSFVTFNEDEELISNRLDRIANKRNRLVHAGTGVSITRSEYNLLKGLVDSKIRSLLDLRDGYDLEEIRFLLDQDSRSTDDLEHRVDLLGELVEWREDDGSETATDR